MDRRAYSHNPIIKGQGICDPHMHVFRDRMYIYCSHDVGLEEKNFCMRDWCIVSSEDLVSWRIESFPRPEDTYIGPTRDCWATDAAERNGKYYFYYSHGMESTGVSVSDDPGTGFKDALGKPLLPKGLTPTFSYDPCVFIDDDEQKTPYIIFGTPVWAGGDSYYIARLNEDMISLAEKPRKIALNDYADDKPALHKYNGKYYLSWASHYAIADNVYGPYRYAGFTGASTDHGNFTQWRGQWFQAFTIFDPFWYNRATGLCYVHFKDNGEMVTDQLIREYGVGQYEGSWNRIEAEWYMEIQNARKVEMPYGGFGVRADNGGWIRFPHIHDVPANAGIGFYAGTDAEKDAVIEIRDTDPDGALLGICEIRRPQQHLISGYDYFVAKLNNRGGEENLCLVFRGKDDRSVVTLDWFKLFER